MEASESQKVQIKGKSRLKTDVYNNNSFDLAGFNSILWFGSMCETYRIHYFFISMSFFLRNLNSSFLVILP